MMALYPVWHCFKSTVQIFMSEKELFEQLFNTHSSPAKPQEEAGKDLLSGLFAATASLQPKKKKKEEEVHEYVRLAEKSSDKAKKSVQKWKQEQTMTPQQVQQKRNIEKITTQFEKAKQAPPPSSIVPPPSSKVLSTQKKTYMPTVINPFEKADKKDGSKPKSPAVVQPPPKKEEKKEDRQKERERVDREREKEEREERERVAKAKTEAKLEKIKRKEMELAAEKDRAEKAAAALAAKSQPKPQRPQQQKQAQKQKQERPIKKAVKKDKKESQSSSGSQSSSQKSSQKYDWRAQLRSITKYNPNDEKFKKLDKEVIKESGIDRIFGEDRFSSRWGKLEEEEDLRREMRMKHRKDKDRHHHKHH